MRCFIVLLAGLATVSAVAVLASGAEASGGKSEMSVAKEDFGKTADGEAVAAYTCTNAKGAVMKVLERGAVLMSVEVPDREGKNGNVLLGYKTPQDWLNHTSQHFGCVVGRYGNRIAAGKFSLDGKDYTLNVNTTGNHLHGGTKGFCRHVWKSEPIESGDVVGVKFTLHSPDGDENYPGAMDATVTYTLNNQNEVKLDYTATTDKPTVLNLTNHAFWNIGGAGSGDVLGEELTVMGDKYLVPGKGLIPTGATADVKGTPFDFTSPHKIGERIAEAKKDPEAKGYDHCYVLRSQDGKLALAARVKDPKSGRVMEVLTTQPGLQVYTGNNLSGTAKDAGYGPGDALCLETQHYPDSPNHPDFPSTVLKPGQTYHQTTVYRFAVE